MEFSVNNSGVEKVSSVPINGRSWSRSEMSGSFSSSAHDASAVADNPAPAPSAAARVTKLRRPINSSAGPCSIGFISVCAPLLGCVVSVGEFVEQAGEFVLGSHDSPVRILASARAWRDLTVPGRPPRWAAPHSTGQRHQTRDSTRRASSAAAAAIGDLVCTAEAEHLADNGFDADARVIDGGVSAVVVRKVGGFNHLRCPASRGGCALPIIRITPALVVVSAQAIAATAPAVSDSSSTTITPVTRFTHTHRDDRRKARAVLRRCASSRPTDVAAGRWPTGGFIRVDRSNEAEGAPAGVAGKAPGNGVEAMSHRWRPRR